MSRAPTATAGVVSTCLVGRATCRCRRREQKQKAPHVCTAPRPRRLTFFLSCTSRPFLVARPAGSHPDTRISLCGRARCKGSRNAGKRRDGGRPCVRMHARAHGSSRLRSTQDVKRCKQTVHLTYQSGYHTSTKAPCSTFWGAWKSAHVHKTGRAGPWPYEKWLGPWDWIPVQHHRERW